MTDLLRLPKAPSFDPDSGENPFAWIVRTAPTVRAQRQQAEADHRQVRLIEARLYNRPLKP